jgi:hypothetical protein
MAIAHRNSDGTIAPGPHRDVDERFWEKVEFEDPIFPENGCMNWTAALAGDGYPRFGDESGKVVKAIRWIYERLREPIQPGFHLHHLCRNKTCVNPDHVEPKTAQEHGSIGPFNPWGRNVTHCKYGHEFTPENTYLCLRDGAMRRYCRICRLENKRRYNAKLKKQ